MPEGNQEKIQNLPERPIAPEVNVASIPDEIKADDRWVVWCYEIKTNSRGLKKWTKVPYQAQLTEGEERFACASSVDPRTWRSFQQAHQFYERFRFDGRLGVDGIGFMLGGEYVGFDADHCFDPQTNTLAAEARWAVAEINSYSEISPSGTGVKVLAKGKKPEGRCKHGDFEMYQVGRFFTITGKALPGMPTIIEHRQPQIEKIHTRLFPKEVKKELACKNQGTPPPSSSWLPTDEAIVAKATSATNGEKFQKLWSGDWQSEYNSQSDADLALCALLAFWCKNDAERIDYLFHQSGLIRDKWDSRRPGGTYGSMTITMVTENNPVWYTWDHEEQAELSRQAEECIRPPDQAKIDALPSDKAEESKEDMYRKGTYPEPFTPDNPLQTRYGLILTWNDIVARAKTDKVVWIIDQIIGAGEVSMPHSLPWGGKSTILAKAVASVCQGEDFFGYSTIQVPVLYINADRNSYDLFLERIDKHVQDKDAMQNYLFAPEFEYIPGPLPPDYLDVMVAAIRARTGSKHIWVIIDTMRPAFLVGSEAGSENDSTIMTNILNPLKALAMREKVAVTPVHHNSRGTDDYAGSASTAGKVDAFINISRDKDSDTAEVKIHTRRGLRAKLMVHRDLDGHLSLVSDGDTKIAKTVKDKNLDDFMNQFPRLAPEAITFEDVMKMEYVVDRGWTERTLRNKISEASKAGRFPRLENVSTDTKNARYIRV